MTKTKHLKKGKNGKPPYTPNMAQKRGGETETWKGSQIEPQSCCLKRGEIKRGGSEKREPTNFKERGGKLEGRTGTQLYLRGKRMSARAQNTKGDMMERWQTTSKSIRQKKETGSRLIKKKDQPYPSRLLPLREEGRKRKSPLPLPFKWRGTSDIV